MNAKSLRTQAFCILKSAANASNSTSGKIILEEVILCITFVNHLVKLYG